MKFVLMLRDYFRKRQYGYPHDKAWELAKKYSN